MNLAEALCEKAKMRASFNLTQEEDDLLVKEIAKLTKTHLKDKAQHFILETLLEAQKKHEEQRVATGIPITQLEEFDEILEKQIERVFRFLGR